MIFDFFSYSGHYVTTLFRDGQWIDCNDTVLSPATEAPAMGYLFFYDRVQETQSFPHGTVAM